jgi:hypothetical protein
VWKRKEKKRIVQTNNNNKKNTQQKHNKSVKRFLTIFFIALNASGSLTASTPIIGEGLSVEPVICGGPGCMLLSDRK